MGIVVPYAELVSVVACVLLSVLFSGSETALNALGISRLEKLRERLRESDRKAPFIEIWAERRNEALTCILIGNNVVNITASALTTDAFRVMFLATSYSNLAIPVAIFVTTFVILTFGEIIPKTYAQNNAERFAMVTVVLYPIWGLLKPLTWAFTQLSEWFIVKTGGRVDQSEIEVTEEDIEDHIERAVEQGHLDEVQQSMIESVLELDDAMVRDVMRPRTRMVAVPDDGTAEEILGLLEESGHSRYPVYGVDLDEIKGVLHVRDLLRHFKDAPNEPLQLERYMRPPYRVPDTKIIADCIREMQAARVHMAIVMDEHGQVAGLVTLEDIIEEVFGEIYDEYDKGDVGEDLIRQLGERRWEVQAQVSILDLQDALEIEFPEEDETYSTVAGYIVRQANDIPSPGFEAELHGFRFRVLEADDTRVIRVGILGPEATVPAEDMSLG